MDERSIPIPKDIVQDKKGEILSDESKFFHGIGYDLLRMRSILQHGILSENAAVEQNITIARSGRGFNLNDSISVALPPNSHKRYGAHAFGLHMSNAISFVVDKKNISFSHAPSDKSIRDSGFVDEAYIYDKVPVENISGIMLPEEMLDSKIYELPLGLDKMAWGFIDNRCRTIITELKKFANFEADTSILEELIVKKDELEKLELNFLDKQEYRKKIIEAMDLYMRQQIGSAFALKFGKEDLTLKDVIKEFISSNLTIYNTNGFPITLD